MAEPFFKASVRIPKAWRDARGNFPREVREATKRAADLVIRVFKQQVRGVGAVASRNLVNGAKSRVLRDSGVRGWYTRGIFIEGPAASYWQFADRRRRGGKMPIDVEVTAEGKFRWRPFPHVANYLRLRGVPVERWWVAIRSMARGFRGHHFVAATVRIARPLVREEMETAVEAVRKRLGGR